MLSRLEFFFTETFLSLRRHPAMAFAAIICVAASLFVASMAGLALLNADYMVDTQLNRLRVTVFFQTETTHENAMQAMSRIQGMDGVDTVEFVSRATAWYNLKMKDPKLAELVGGNPYPDSVIIKASDATFIPRLSNEIKQWAEVKKVSDPGGATDVLIKARQAISQGGIVTGIILAILALVIIHHTIELTLYARRKEIHIMSLVGATPSTVAMPFLLEGLLYGIIGAGIALGCAFALYRFISQVLLQSYGTHLQQDPVLLMNGLLGILIAGAALGLVGSIASVIKYLHRPRSRITNA